MVDIHTPHDYRRRVIQGQYVNGTDLKGSTYAPVLNLLGHKLHLSRWRCDLSKCKDGDVISLHCGYGRFRDHLVVAMEIDGDKAKLVAIDM